MKYIMFYANVVERNFLREGLMTHVDLSDETKADAIVAILSSYEPFYHYKVIDAESLPMKYLLDWARLTDHWAEVSKAVYDWSIEKKQQ